MEKEKLLEDLKAGRLKLKDLSNFDSGDVAEVLRSYLSEKYGASLSAIANNSIDANDAVGKNIENFVGAAQVPLGFAGELEVKGEYASLYGKQFPILIATTEGRLVAGLGRGIALLNKSGGATARVISDGMTRSTVIETDGIASAKAVYDFVNSDEGFAIAKEAFESTTNHGRLFGIKAIVEGREVYLRFVARTGAAMGMNMVTIASKAASEKIVECMNAKGISCRLVTESGNLCTDKKPAMVNAIEGRGVTVVAEASIDKALISKTFGVDAEELVHLNMVKNLKGSALAGSYGYNGHVANILAGIFIATGQDVAQIVEGSAAIVSAEIVNGSFYISIRIPALEIGTYGGGTGRETQKEILKLMHLYGEGDAEGDTRLALAEVIASACLAGELNLLGTEASLTLAKSHASLKRK